MKVTETMIVTAGVYRCCIASIQELPVETEVQIGAKHNCKHCGEAFTLHGHDAHAVWRADYWQDK